MALTGMQIYKSLPRTNCKDCGFPTCMAFAMQVAAKQKALTDCPHVSESAKSELSNASSPPMKLVNIGVEGCGGFKVGQETVMFRHEEKFHNPAVVAVKIGAALPDAEALGKTDRINAAKFMRVGQEIGARAVAVDLYGMGVEGAVARAKLIAGRSRVPLILMSGDGNVLGAAAAATADRRPLLYQADESNAEAAIKAAADSKCPLSIRAETLEGMADLTTAARAKGVEDLILSFDGRAAGVAVREITRSRRAALKKNVRALGYPVIVDVSVDDSMKEIALAGTFIARYAGIVIINGVDGGELLPVLTTIQNLYTDPQVPNTVEAKLYEIGNVGENSPVLFTTNFSLSYFCVEGEVERSKVPAYICAVDTEGLGVLNAYAGDKLSPEKVVKSIADMGVLGKVRHRKLIIPGLLPSFRAEIEDISEWKEVLIGPEAASGIPSFLAQNWKTKET